MLEVTQTTFGFPDQDAPPGDCLAACVAAVLELPIECVPRTRLVNEMADWLRARGLYALTFRCDLSKGDPAPDGYHLVGGWSPRRPDRRDMLHCVVARGREVVWDPHPSRAGVLDWQESTILVPLDPMAVAARAIVARLAEHDARMTPGPWSATASPQSPSGGVMVFDVGPGLVYPVATTCGDDAETIEHAERNAAGIAAIRNALPELLAALELKP